MLHEYIATKHKEICCYKHQAQLFSLCAAYAMFSLMEQPPRRLPMKSKGY